MGKIATCDHFRMADNLVLPATAGAAPFVVAQTTSANTTHLAGIDGYYNISLSSDSEAQKIVFNMGDVLRYDIDDLIRVEWLARVTTASATGVTIVFGLASAINADPDAIVNNAYFKTTGNLAVVCETDDGTTDVDDTATGQTLVTTVARRFAIDFSRDVQTVAPPGTNKGGKGNVHFYMDDANGYLKRVCSSTLFDMSAATAGLQLYALLFKASGATLATLGIKDIKVEHKLIA